MKRHIVYLFLAATFCVIQGSAQSTNASSTPTGPTGPTVKVLAMSRLLADPRSAEVQNTLPYERNAIVRLYLSGKIDQWFVRQDRNGLILVLDVKSVEDARKMLEDLPLDKAKLGTYDLVPLTTWLPLESLLATAPMKPVQ
ncbi:hypothetical protein [Granulicella sp. dw_53]|uniref:hypothetical protein n=1 Tax=Granulicella sp. dw_53 TaxID=2719792 RepID=UPI001BD297B0|nr:hypothetical protein [Granulicella sp. dw_53]